MNSVKIGGVQYYINYYSLGDTYPILLIENFEKLTNARYPELKNVSAFDTSFLVKKVVETPENYIIELVYGIDVLDGNLNLKLSRIPMGFTNFVKPNGSLVKKPVFEISSSVFNFGKILLTSEDCKTPQKFLEFVYISLQDKLPNNIPF